jgi:hypothetical protein
MEMFDIDEIVKQLNDIIPGLELIKTVHGDEIKGWTRDLEEGGTMKFYLNAADCRLLSEAFAKLADNLNQG